MCQISSLVATAEGPVAEFSRFANFEEKKRKSNLLMSFPKTVNQMGSFGQIRKNSIFCFCRPILDIFGFTLLKYWVKGNKFWYVQGFCPLKSWSCSISYRISSQNSWIDFQLMTNALISNHIAI